MRERHPPFSHTLLTSSLQGVSLNPSLRQLLDKAHLVLNTQPRTDQHAGPLWVGVDLGTAYTVVVVVAADGQPVAGAMQFAQVVRDGLVVDFVGAVDLLRTLKSQVEEQLGQPLTAAYSAFPPGVQPAERQATSNVLQTAGLDCLGLIDEPTAANFVLEISDGVIVDVGGGTTGIAVLEDGYVVYTADEPTGGTHFSLVISGALNLPLEEAEQIKTDPHEQQRLFPVIRPVMEKVASIVARHIAGRDADHIYLVGGSSTYPGFADVVREWTDLPVSVPSHPIYVTPLGIARAHLRSVEKFQEQVAIPI